MTGVQTCALPISLTVSGTGSKIEFKTGSNAAATQNVTVDTLNLNGAKFNIGTASATSGTNTTLAAKTVNISGGTIDVNKSGTFTLTSTDLTIANGSTFKVASGNASIDVDNATIANGATIQADASGAITINSYGGTLNIGTGNDGGNAIIKLKAAASKDAGGSLTITNGKVNLAKGAIGTATKGSAATDYAVIEVSGNTTAPTGWKVETQGTFVPDAALSINADDLSTFLTGVDSGAGALDIKAGTLELTALNDATISLNDYTWGSTTTKNTIKTTNDSIITGKNLAVKDAFATAIAGSIVADTLYLSQNIDAATSAVAALNLSANTFTKSLVLIKDDTTDPGYTLMDKVTLENVSANPDYVPSDLTSKPYLAAKDGSVTIQDDATGVLTIGSGGQLTVNGGIYELSNDTVVASGGTLATTNELKHGRGNLRPGEAEGTVTTAQEWADSSSLTLTGKLTLNGGATLSADGEGSVLDVTKVTALEKEGVATESAAQEIKVTTTNGGEVKLTSEQFTSLLNNKNGVYTGADNVVHTDGYTKVSFSLESGELNLDGDINLTAASLKDLNLGANGVLSTAGNITVAGITNAGIGGTLQSAQTITVNDISSTGLNLSNTGVITGDTVSLNVADNVAKDKGLAVNSGTVKVGSALNTNTTGALSFNGSASALVLEATSATTQGTISAANQNLNFNTGAKFAVNKGEWTVGAVSVGNADAQLTIGAAGASSAEDGATLTLSSLTANDNHNEATPAITVNNYGKLVVSGALTAAGYGLKVNEEASATVGSLIATQANAATIAGTLTADAVTTKAANAITLSGNKAKATINGTDAAGAGLSLVANSVSLTNGAHLTLGDKATSIIGTDGKLTTQDVAAGAFDLNNATLHFTFADGTSFTKETLAELRKSLLKDSDGTAATNKGYLDLGNVTLAGYTDALNENGEFDWTKKQVESDVVSDVIITGLNSAQVINFTATSDSFAGNFGSLKAVAGSASKIDNTVYVNVTADGSLNTALKGEGDTIGKFATDASGNNTSFSIAAGKTFGLNNGGEAGNVHLDSGAALTVAGGSTTDANGNITLNTTTIESIGGALNADKSALLDPAQVGNFTQLSGNTQVKGAATVDTLSVQNGALSIAGATTANTIYVDGGSLTAGDTTTKAVQVNNGTFTANVISAANNNGTVNVSVGHLAVGEGDAITGTTGTLKVARLDLNGGTLTVDPTYNEAASLAVIGQLGKANAVSSDATVDKNYAGSLKGEIKVLQNAIAAIGVTDIAASEGQEAVEAVASVKKLLTDSGLLDKNGKLSNAEGKIGAIGYIAKAITLEEGSKLTIDGKTLTAADLTTPSVDEVVPGEGDTSTGGDTTTTPDQGETTPSVTYNTMVDVKNHGALVVSLAAATDATHNGEKVAAIHLATQNGAVSFDNTSKIILTEAPSNTISLFSDDDTTTDGSLSGVKLQGAEGSKVTVQAGVWTTELNVGDDIQSVTMNVNPKEVDKLSDASQPIKDLINGLTTATEDTYLGYASLGGSATGKEIETIARLGAFGGAAQAGLLASKTTTDAISGRQGVGAGNSTLTFADNGQGAGLWVTPIYQSQDSDSFDAQGVEYGADIDLYGVALGADYTLGNGVRIGVAFNVGSGDADGQGVGNLVKNDFNYYGGALYAGYTAGQFSIVGDISYTVVDNDIEADISSPGKKWTKINTSFDTKALSVGVTAQYALDLNGINVTPHAGLRYTSLDLEDYSVGDAYTAQGDTPVANFSADKLNVFSIPVGVTIDSEIATGSWTIKPAVDFTITGNFGDDSADGSVFFVEDNLSTHLESEVVDNFTYGVGLGLAAQHGNFSVGVGVNYTGSSNTNSYGIGANARFVF